MASQEPIGIGSRPDVEAAPTQTAATAAAATPTARTDSVAAPPLQFPSPARGAGWTPPSQLPVQPQQQMDFDPWSGAQLPQATGAPGLPPPLQNPWQDYVGRQPVIGAQPMLQAPWPQPALADQWRAFIPVPEPPPQRTGGVGAPILPRDQT